MKKIALVDDDRNINKLLSMLLQEQGYNVDSYFSGEEFLKNMERDYSVVISDYKLKEITGLDILRKVKELKPLTSVILITAYANIDLAIETIKTGAFDFIQKPINNDEFLIKVKNAHNYNLLLEENLNLKNRIEEKKNYDKIIGFSSAAVELKILLQKAADSNINVLLCGDTGTGKELAAKYIHYNSIRKDAPFIALNCSTIPYNLFESELFGHKKGAFTSADKDYEGKFLAASKGTLFLDEISELPMDIQPKLLRVLQEKTFMPVGSNEYIKIDVRIIAATNKNLEELVKNNRFREDLYYRINVLQINIPALKQRKDDISVLINHFINKYSENKQIKISEAALKLLLEYSWPGNIRELENVIHRAIILSSDNIIMPMHLPENIKNKSITKIKNSIFDLPDEGIDMEELENNLIRQALKKTSNNQTLAAKLLGMSRATLIYRVQKMNSKE